MKFRTWSVASGLLLAVTVATAQNTAPVTTMATPPAAETEHAGFVKNLQGDVQLLSPGGEARPAHAGDSLAPVDRLVTGKDSAASVVLRDGTTMVLGPSSQLDLKAYSFDATTRDGGVLVSLLRGTLRMITGLIGKTHPDAIRVETQTATIGIRGTDFIVQADAQP